jgi:NAD(P)-dependent dehydrogenase (short-subunit alcohol dehydrogenase family)
MTRIAIITGASSGIGAATAQLFLQQSFSVINVSRRPCPVSGVDNLCGDLVTTDAVRTVAEGLASAVRTQQAIEVCLIHNAALMLKDSAENCTDDSFDRAFHINVSAINTLNRQLIPLMPKGSSIQFIGSTLSEKAVGGAFSYVVTKHAQLGMMRATTQDLMGRGIHTALICPGFTDTEMLRGHVGNDEAILSNIGKMNSFGRLIDPDEIARLVVWSHQNPVINGSVLHANLGQLEH